MVYSNLVIVIELKKALPINRYILLWIQSFYNAKTLKKLGILENKNEYIELNTQSELAHPL